jgi:hypothetical protein
MTTYFFPLHFASLFLLGVACLASLLAGGTVQRSCRLLSAIVLPVGIAGTFVGFIVILSSMADPSQLIPAVTSTLPTALYAGVLKIALDVCVPEDPSTPVLSNSTRTKIAAGVWLAAFLSFDLLTTPHVFYLLNFSALGVLALCVALIFGLNKLAGEDAPLTDSLTRTLPKIGLLALVYTVFAMPAAMSDVTAIGPLMAFGLLIHLYTNLFGITLGLAQPDRLLSVDPLAHWLYWSASLACICAFFGCLLILIS